MKRFGDAVRQAAPCICDWHDAAAFSQFASSFFAALCRGRTNAFRETKGGMSSKDQRRFGAAQKAFASGTGKTGCPPAGRPSWKTYSGTAAARKRAAEQAAQTAAEARAACEMQAAALLQS